MALDFIELLDGNKVLRKVLGKFDASLQFKQAFFIVGARGSETFASVVNGTALDVSDTPLRIFSFQVRETGTVGSWTVVLEHSIDGVIFKPLLTHTKAANGDGGIISSGPVETPSSFLRLSCTALTLSGGTNVIATFQGMA